MAGELNGLFSGDLRFYEGKTVNRVYRLLRGGLPIDLSPYFAGSGLRCQIRENVTAASALATPILSSVGQDADGQFRFELASSATLGVVNGRTGAREFGFVLDIEGFASSAVIDYLGSCTDGRIQREISRSLL